MLHGSAEVPEVGRGAQQVTVGLKHLDRRDRERRSPNDLHAFDFGSVAPATTASNISWQCGDGVWWTISRRATGKLPIKSI
jgi:hypothetical protein